MSPDAIIEYLLCTRLLVAETQAVGTPSCAQAAPSNGTASWFSRLSSERLPCISEKGGGHLLSPLFQMRKVRLREVKSVAPQYTAVKWWSLVLNSSFPNPSPWPGVSNRKRGSR
jgi:hypothetical protein